MSDDLKRRVAGVSYGNDEPKGQIVACIVTPRTDHAWPMFYGRTDGTIVANLVGYRITPLTDEEMRALGCTPAGEPGERAA